MKCISPLIHDKGGNATTMCFAFLSVFTRDADAVVFISHSITPDENAKNAHDADLDKLC
ncbi:uncharacterized protein TrAtP1_006708 [Trichoderma atroviride]|uniref:uncharacterized protein n=1 Tax=Hypocrea atroviridis TaxID=63577 RepID=UPI003320F1F9|nr:hypothetical protein TrAtP1_006708 [Trichoderma atroviride]